jgi:hypothetical protein
MKTLQESLFDQDVKKINVQIGELYELSEAPHHNFFSNDPLIFMDLFKYKELKKWNCKFVDLDNNFIEYWEKRRGILGLAALIDIILQIPAIMLINQSEFQAARNIKKELKPYVKPSDYDSLYVGVRKIKDLVEISIYDNLDSSTPHSMKIMLKKK